MRSFTRTLTLIVVLLFLLPAIVRADGKWAIEQAGNLTSIAVSEDGERVAVGSYGAAAYIFDTTGNELFRTEADNVVTGVRLLSDGTLLVSSDDRRLYAYDEAGQLLWETNLKRQVKGVSASLDGGVIAAFLQGSPELMLIERDTGELLQPADVGIAIKAIDVASEGSRIAVGATDQYVYVLNEERDIISKLGLSGSIEAVAITDEGAVAVGTSFNEVEIFGPDGEKTAAFQTRDTVTDVAFSRDGEYIAVSDYAGYYYVLSSDGSKLLETRGTGAGRVVAFDPEGHTLYAGNDKGELNSFDVRTIIQSAKQQQTKQAILWGGAATAVAALLLYGLFTMKKRNKLHLFRVMWRSKWVYIALAPSFILLFVFLYYPAFSGLFHSLYDWNPGGRTTFVGLDNFRRMLEDPYVTKGVGNLALLIMTGLVKTIIPPLIAAELIYHIRSKKLQYGYRTAFVASMIIPGVALLLIWQNLYDPNIGLVNHFLQSIGLGSQAHAWLGDPKTALWAIIFIGFPFIGILQLLVLYAGLLAIPEDMIESAKIDGAGLPRIIRSIHLPLLAGQFKFLIILGLIGIIQDFNSILIVTGGGPMDSTYVPALQMYYAATKFDDLGYASALGVAMFIVILVITIVNMKLIKTSQD